MITKAIVRSINAAGNRCIVRMPLFENASDLSPVEAEALVSITPGFFNNLNTRLNENDIVFVSFEENALEKPVIIGKLYKGTDFESQTYGGSGILASLLVRDKAQLPALYTTFEYKDIKLNDEENLALAAEYTHFTTPRKIADYIKWLEKLTKKLAKQLDNNFRCLKNWTQWQLKAENVEVDDGDIDTTDYKDAEAFQYQEEDKTCKICSNNGTCTKTKSYLRTYTFIEPDKPYDNLDINIQNQEESDALL